MAGSKRNNLFGFILEAHPDQVVKLRRLGSDHMQKLFREAQETGQTLVMLDDEMWAIHRRSDHTFFLARQSDEHRHLV